MAVSSFPPVSGGGGGGGSSPVPGATTEVVKGKFKLFAAVETPLEPGSYVATVLATGSGSTDLDSKKLTSRSVGALKAGITTLETVTQPETGIAFFAKPVTYALPTTSSSVASIRMNANRVDQPTTQSYVNNYRWSGKAGQYTYLFMKSNFYETTGAQRAKSYAFRTLDGVNWSEDGTMSQSPPSNINTTQWRNPSYMTTINGKSVVYHGPTDNSSNWSGIYCDSSDGANWTSKGLADQQQWYQAYSGPSVAYQFGTTYFALGGLNKSCKTDDLNNSWTNVQANLPNFGVGNPVGQAFGPVAGTELALGSKALVMTTDSWATSTRREITDLGVSGITGAYAIGISSSYTCLSINQIRSFVYSTDLVNWNLFQIPGSLGVTLSYIFFDTRINRWIAGSSSINEIYYSNSANPTGSWGIWSGYSGWNNHILAVDSSSNRIYGRTWGTKNVSSFIPFSTGMSSASQAWSQNLLMFAAASNPSGSVTLLGGYGDSPTGGNNSMLVRSTNESTFTEVASPFGTGDQYISNMMWDATNNQFIITAYQGKVATSPDGLTWTIRGNADDTGEVLLFSTFGASRSKGGVHHLSGYNYPLNRATTPTLTDIQPAQTKFVRANSEVVYAIEEAGDVYVVTNSGVLVKQLTATPTFDLSNAIGTGATFADSNNGTRTPMKKVNGIWFAFSENNTVRYSTNFSFWQTLIADGIPVQDIEYDATNNRYVAVGPSSIAYSSDLITWYGVVSTEPEGRRSGITITDGNVTFTKASTNTEFAVTTGRISQTEEFGILYYNSDLETL